MRVFFILLFYIFGANIILAEDYTYDTKKYLGPSYDEYHSKKSNYRGNTYYDYPNAINTDTYNADTTKSGRYTQPNPDYNGNIAGINNQTPRNKPQYYMPPLEKNQYKPPSGLQEYYPSKATNFPTSVNNPSYTPPPEKNQYNPLSGPQEHHLLKSSNTTDKKPHIEELDKSINNVNSAGYKNYVELETKYHKNAIERKLHLALLVVFSFFITVLGVLKGAEGKAVFFNSRKDYKFNLAFGLLTVFLIILSLIIFNLYIAFAYTNLFIGIFLLINTIISYRINKGLKIIPLAMGFSRIVIVFFIPIIELIASICMNGESYLQKEGESDEDRKKRLDENKSGFVQLGTGLHDFVHACLLNKIGVVLNKMYRSAKDTEKKMEKLKDILGHKELGEEADKNIDNGEDFHESVKESYEDFGQKMDEDYSREEKNESTTTDNNTESPYEILGVSESASIEEIKTAYRKKMKEYHPDKTNNLGEKLKDIAEEETKKINAAYDAIMKQRE